MHVLHLHECTLRTYDKYECSDNKRHDQHRTHPRRHATPQLPHKTRILEVLPMQWEQGPPSVLHPHRPPAQEKTKPQSRDEPSQNIVRAGVWVAEERMRCSMVGGLPS